MSKQTLSISELLQLQSTIKGEIGKAERLVGQGAFEEVTGEIETEKVTVEEHQVALETLEVLHDLAIQIADKLHEANRGTTFKHETSEGIQIDLNLASALDYVKQLRTKAKLFARLGGLKEKTVSNNYGSTDRIVKTVKHDIKAFEAKATTLEKEANRLSREIERQSVLATVELEGVEAYL